MFKWCILFLLNIQGISSNRQLPSLKMLFRICEYFDISLREFFCENEIQALILNITESMNDLDEEDLLLVCINILYVVDCILCCFLSKPLPSFPGIYAKKP